MKYLPFRKFYFLGIMGNPFQICYYFKLFIFNLANADVCGIKHPLWDAFLYMGNNQAPPAPCFVFLITL